jgi:hypothetical protein
MIQIFSAKEEPIVMNLAQKLKLAKQAKDIKSIKAHPMTI